MRTRIAILVLAWLSTTASFEAAGPIRYRFSFPEPQHRWMQVEATFSDVGAAPLELRISRSSPGRYSLHDFAKNVYDVHAFGADGRELPTTRPDPYGWTVAGHGGAVTVKYKVYGDRVDGTYLAVDETHAHINMPAAIMWAHGLEDRPVAIEFEAAAGAAAPRVATQLHPGTGPLQFTAPNLQYLMDSPAEVSPSVAIREFTVDGSRFRFALHHTGTDAELDAFAKDVERVVREEGAIYGEYPAYEPGYYTFLADYLPWADGDGMEHRNSTVMTSRGAIARNRRGLLETVAHEFFHGWNVERIRPRGLEPFDFDRANLADELWLAEGFTQYYGPLVLQRAGLIDLDDTARTLTGLVEEVSHNSAVPLRSAVEMSRMAPFIDGGRSIDRTNWSTTVISYYPFGGAIALALDLSLRDRTSGRVTLDDFMRAMWRSYGKPGGGREGYVDRPYTVADAQETLAAVSGDRAFAHEFFSKYIEGHEVAPYDTLLAKAGFTVRHRNPGGAWLGRLTLEAHGDGGRITELVAPDTPAYTAGLEQDDVVKEIEGQPVRSQSDLDAALKRHKPGERVRVGYVTRDGQAKSGTTTLAEDPRLEVVPSETVGSSLTTEQRAFRDRWLASPR